MKAYLVTVEHGEDGYKCLASFDKEEDARNCADLIGANIVTVYRNPPMQTAPIGYTRYRIRLYPEYYVENINKFLNIGMKPVGVSPYRGYELEPDAIHTRANRFDGTLQVVTWARSEEHAFEFGMELWRLLNDPDNPALRDPDKLDERIKQHDRETRLSEDAGARSLGDNGTD